jgi:hypothetical protein
MAGLVLTGCAAPMSVSSYLERGIDFTRYRTYNWDPAGPQATGDPRLDNNPFFQERVQADVEKQLATRGFEKSTSGTPELLIHIHASITQELNVNNADQRYGPCDDCKPYVYDAGTLLLDFVDTRTNKLIWRGWAEGSMEGDIDNQQRMEEKVDRAVTRILERLPRRL